MRTPGSSPLSLHDALPISLPRVIAWGCLMGALVMALYRLISPQRKLAAIKADAAAARRQIAGFDGEFDRSEEHTSELQSRLHLVCRLLLEKKNIRHQTVWC